MLQRVKTETTECWAILLPYSLEEISNIQLGLIDLMMAATTSEAFESSGSRFFDTLSILREFMPTSTQAMKYEEYLMDVEEIRE